MADYKSKHTGAAIDAGIDKANAAVSTNQQTLIEEQKTTARANIDAAKQAKVEQDNNGDYTLIL